MSMPPFLSLDGIDDIGKSTQCRLLVHWLNSAGVPTFLCADPGGTPLGDRLPRRIRRIVAQFLATRRIAGKVEP